MKALEKQLNLDNRKIELDESDLKDETVFSLQEVFENMASKVDGKDELLLEVKEASNLYSGLSKKLKSVKDTIHVERVILSEQKVNDYNAEKNKIMQEANIDQIFKQAMDIGRSMT